MSAESRDTKSPSSGSNGTLGDLLYTSDSPPTLAEEDWVQLVAAVGNGHQSALNLLYNLTHRLVYTLAFRITRNRETAEEVTLDVFHDVWRRAATFDRDGGTVVGWIMNQARSRAIDRLRFDQRKKRVKPDFEDPESTRDDSSSALEGAQRDRALRELLKVLSHEERQAIETAFFSELTYAEVALGLNQPLGTVKTRIRSALLKLRDASSGIDDFE